MRRRVLLLPVIGSESSFFFLTYLSEFLKYLLSNKFKIPKISFIITDLAAAFFNSFTRVFSKVCGQSKFIWIYCSWHLNRCILKRIDIARLPDKIRIQCEKKILPYYIPVLYVRLNCNGEYWKLKCFP